MKRVILLPASVIITGIALLFFQFSQADVTPSPTPTETASVSVSVSPSLSPTVSMTPTSSPNQTASPTISPSATPSSTVSPTLTPSPNSSVSSSPSPSGTFQANGLNRSNERVNARGTANVNTSALGTLFALFPRLMHSNDTVQVQVYNQSNQLVFEHTFPRFSTLWSMMPTTLTLDTSMLRQFNLSAVPAGSYVVSVRIYNTAGKIVASLPNVVTVNVTQ
jgi:hypothetical protein